jgi:hypothetical protein
MGESRPPTLVCELHPCSLPTTLPTGLPRVPARGREGVEGRSSDDLGIGYVSCIRIHCLLPYPRASPASPQGNERAWMGVLAMSLGLGCESPYALPLLPSPRSLSGALTCPALAGPVVGRVSSRISRYLTVSPPLQAQPRPPSRSPPLHPFPPPLPSTPPPRGQGRQREGRGG